MSASASTPFMHNDRVASAYGRAFVDAVGGAKGDNNGVDKILKRLRSLPARALVEKTSLFKDWDVSNPMPWKPVVDSGFCEVRGE